MTIENGINKNYIENLTAIDAKSNLRRSLLSTMIDLSSQYNKDAPYCGEADALMLLSLGNRSEMNLAGSGSTYYKKAIQLKNNYVEAYLLYGRSLLNGNNSVGESIDKILNMLDKAPYSEEIKKLKAEIISWKDENLY